MLRNYICSISLQHVLSLEHLRSCLEDISIQVECIFCRIDGMVHVRFTCN